MWNSHATSWNFILQRTSRAPLSSLPICWQTNSATTLHHGRQKHPLESDSNTDFQFDTSNPHKRSHSVARIEAVLLVAGGPIPIRKLTQVAMVPDHQTCQKLISELNAIYQAQSSPFVVELLASGYQLMTRPEYAFWLNRLHNRKAAMNLSTVALETLAIIAYKQPTTRADIEKIRGVHCAEVVKQLMDRNLVRIAGVDDSLGRPYLYETTPLFLELFGFSNLDELPGKQPEVSIAEE
jgi:segregation and condensation protein B